MNIILQHVVNQELLYFCYSKYHNTIVIMLLLSIILLCVINQSVVQPSVVNVKCFIMSSMMSIISVSSHAECYSTKCYFDVKCHHNEYHSVAGH